MAASFNQKQNVTLTFRLRDKNKDPWDLNSKQIVAKLIYNGTLTNFSCAIVGSPYIGKVSLTLTDEQTALLAAGDLEIDVYVGTYAAAPTISPSTDSTEQIFLIRDVTVLEVQA